MLFFNCFDSCDLSEIFFDGFCAIVEFFFPQYRIQIISVLPVSVLHLSLFFLLSTLPYFYAFLFLK